jgi:hypothetical protein
VPSHSFAFTIELIRTPTLVIGKAKPRPRQADDAMQPPRNHHEKKSEFARPRGLSLCGSSSALWLSKVVSPECEVQTTAMAIGQPAAFSSEEMDF